MNGMSFYLKEWQLLGAFLKGFQVMPAEFYDDGHTHRPWLPMERLEMAYKAIVAKSIEFKCTRYDKDNNKFITFAEPPSNEVRECKRIFEGIMDWDNGTLTDCFDKAGRICENLGFTACNPAPIALARPKGVRDIDDLLNEGAKPEPVIVTKTTKTIEDLEKESAKVEEETAVDPGHPEALADGEVVENLTPLEKARAAKAAKKAAANLGLTQPELKAPGAPVTVPSV